VNGQTFVGDVELPPPPLTQDPNPTPDPSAGWIDPPPSMAAAAGAGLDGRLCPEHIDSPGLTGQEPWPWTNTSRIGAPPFDLGALLQGSASVPVFVFDPSAIVADVLAKTPLADPLGYGAAFALGSGGTVSPASGAFTHDFTLLSLPTDVADMGLTLEATYVSNAVMPPDPFLPFGPSWFLSGYDYLDETQPDPGLGAFEVWLYRADGHRAKYLRNGCTTQGSITTCTYTSPSGAFDTLTWQWDGNVNTPRRYARTIDGGRAIWYLEVLTQATRFVREKVVDPYGNQVAYEYDYAASGTRARLKAITDIRGVKVHLLWADVPNVGYRVSAIELDHPSLPNLTPSVPVGNLRIDLGYETGSGRLSRIEYFPTKVAQDLAPTEDGRITLPGELFEVRPRVDLEYDAAHGHKLARLIDATFPSLPVTRLENAWVDDPLYGLRVVAQAEGSLTDPTAPQHTYQYPDMQSDLVRVYVDPQGTTTTMVRNSLYQITSVVMVASPAGKPREPGMDHDMLSWAFAYSACCPLPAWIHTPESRRYEFTWHNGMPSKVSLGTLGQMLLSYDFEYAGSWLTKLSCADPATRACCRCGSRTRRAPRGRSPASRWRPTRTPTRAASHVARSRAP
jgi:hypothetical protein